MPALYALYVVNKSGGLIYYKVDLQGTTLYRPTSCSVSPILRPVQEFVPIASLQLNDTLRLASIW